MAGNEFSETVTKTPDELWLESVGGLGAGASVPSGRDVLTYPLNQTDQKAWMSFIPVDRESLYGAASANLPGIGESVANAFGFISEDLEGAAKGFFDEFTAAGGGETVLSDNMWKQAEYAINMYLPENIQINDAVNYSPVELGILGAAAEQAIYKGGNMATAMMKLAGEGITSTFDVLGKVVGGASIDNDAVKIGLLRVLQRGAFGDRIPAAFGTATGIALNPNVRSLLSSVSLRDFSFTFRMVPETKEESVQIQKIVDTFRSEMYPEGIEGSVAGGGEISLGYKFPRMFMIRMFYNGNVLPIDIKPVVLKSMSTVYNPSNYGWHEDGSPSELQMTLSFGEDRTLDKKDLRGHGNAGGFFAASEGGPE